MPNTKGKSAIVRKIAEENNFKLIDVRLAERDPTDLSGFPLIENGRSDYAPPVTFPLDTDPKPKGSNGWLLFLDEISNAPVAVQNVAYKLILDRKVGERNLHPDVHIVAAGNKATDGCHVEQISSALISRMAVFEVEVNPEEWIEWATQQKLDKRIVGYVSWRKEHLYTFNTDSAEAVYASPRTWEFTHRLIKDKSHLTDCTDLLASLLSEGVAREFISFSDIYHSKLPKLSDILEKPTKTAVPEDVAVRYAVISMLVYEANEDNLEVIIKYIDRFPKEFTMLALKQIRRKGNLSVSENPHLRAWCLANKDLVM